MKKSFLLFIILLLGFSSCKKDKHSCTDGIFSPDYEEHTDCGGVCKACVSFTDTNKYVYARINGKNTGFSNFTLTKNAYWIFSFHNDSTYVTLNFGNGDYEGGRPMLSAYSAANLGYTSYSTLVEGTVAFDTIDHTKNELTGIFEATFASSSGDTLHITNGTFTTTHWE